jgi:hypothetical protein
MWGAGSDVELSRFALLLLLLLGGGGLASMRGRLERERRDTSQCRRRRIVGWSFGVKRPTVVRMARWLDALTGRGTGSRHGGRERLRGTGRSGRRGSDPEMALLLCGCCRVSGWTDSQLTSSASEDVGCVGSGTKRACVCVDVRVRECVRTRYTKRNYREKSLAKKNN